MNTAFHAALTEVFSARQMPLTDDQAAAFEVFYEMLLEKNRVMNLTRITEPAEAAEKHFFDSVSVLKFFDLPQGASIADIGAGAGFPGIPLAILRPDLRLTLIDSSAKKVGFIRKAAEALRLNNVCAVSGRAEELGRDPSFRAVFDIALSRAVAHLPVLLELCAPFVKSGGLFIAYKGAEHEEELAASRGAAAKLHLALRGVQLPYETRSHALIAYEKTGATHPQFPRQFAQIKKRPL